MAKVAFSKLGLKINNEIKTIKFNEQVIEVKQYLPINDKLELISNVINSAHDEQNFSNPVKTSVFTALEILYFYTNINFTDKQKEDPTKLYDLITSSGLYHAVIETIPEIEITEVLCGINESIEAIYAYQNSVMGILENVMTDYSNMSLEANDIYNKLADPENMELVKSVLTKLG